MAIYTWATWGSELSLVLVSAFCYAPAHHQHLLLIPLEKLRTLEEETVY